MYIKSKRFCTESSFDSTLRKPKKTACGVTSNKVKSFSKNKARSFHNFELYPIRKIDGALSHQKVCRKDKEVTLIFET